MQRIIWIGGVACVAQVACIEDRTPSGDPTPDAAAPDASVEPDAGPRLTVPAPVEPEPMEPEPSEPEPNEPEPNEPEPNEPEPNEPEPAPEPEPELPPWVCPPEGQSVFYYIGACVGDAGGLPEPGRFEARITEIGEGIPANGPCAADSPQLILGHVGSDRARWFHAATPDGRVWQILLDLPVEVRFEVDEAVVIDAQVGQGDEWFGGISGSLAISTAEGLRAFVQASRWGAPSLDDAELHLGRGDQSCYWEQPGDSCTYTGFQLNARDPRVDEVHALSYGEIVDVGPFQVINGGIMSIGDQGACNAPPEDFKVAAWRRR